MSQENMPFIATISLLILFIGIFTISTIYNLTAPGDISSYVYASSSNSSASYLNSTINATHKLSIGAISSLISGVTPTKSLTTTVSNYNATDDFTVTAYLNNVSLGSFTAVKNTNTTHTFNNLAFVANAANNITYENV